jgi:hypothetical protein
MVSDLIANLDGAVVGNHDRVVASKRKRSGAFRREQAGHKILQLWGWNEKGRR